MHFMSVLSKTPIILVIGALIMGGVVKLSAQTSTQPENPPTPISSGTILLHNYRGQIWRIDPTSDEKSLIVDLGAEVNNISNMTANLETQLLYVLQTPGYGGGVWLGNAYIIEVNLLTGENHILYERRNVFQMRFSPNMENAVLFYYPADLIRIHPSNLLYYACILNIESQECLEIGEIGYGIGFGAIWVSDEQILRKTREGDWYLIELGSLNGTRIPLSIAHGAILPTDSTKVLLSQRDYFNLYILDLTTLNISEYAHTSNIGQHAMSHYFQISPDGQYLTTQGYPSEGEFNYIIEYATGEVIAELEDIRFVGWMPDSKSIVAITRQTGSEYPRYIVRYNIETGNLTTLTSFGESTVVSVVP